MIPLHSLDDPRLDPYRNLPRANLTRLSGRFIVEGPWMVERLAASPYAVESVVVEENQLDRVPANLPPDVPVYGLSKSLIEQLIGFNFHRGILACGRRAPLADWRTWTPDPNPALFVACLDIHDPMNLGGILRNCAAFGVTGVLLNSRCADPFSRRVLRVSMGTVFRLKLAACSSDDLRELREALRCEVVATVLRDDAEHLEQAPRAERMLLLLGNEGHGLGEAAIAAADRLVTLPMDLGTDSLNAASASAVFLYHFARVAVSRSSA